MQAMFRSAMFKLTAAYVGIVMLICIVFSGVFYHLAVTELHTGIYNQYSRWFNAYEPFGLRQPNASPASELSARAHHVATRLAYLNLIILVVASGASYGLARRTLKPIRAAHEQQKRFTADVSHELRTPLTAIKMETEVSLLDPKAKAAELRRVLESNLEEVGHMEILINNLLQLTTIEADKLRTDFRPHDIQDILAEAGQTVQRLAAAKQIVINSETISRMVMVDRGSFTQLFVILLENAIKYSPDGSSIEVRAYSGRSRLHIDITDHGLGIAAEALQHVFDRFYRASDARRDHGNGTVQGYGLGLSLAKLIADLHGAEIVLSSAEGQGTTASVII